MRPDSRVILCTAEPSWVHANEEDENALGNLAYLERIVVEKGSTVALSLAGDLHHYARYSAGGGSCQKITSGGGGAFFHETHNLPEKLTLRGRLRGGTKTTTYTRGRTFPDVNKSRWLIVRNLLFQAKNPYFAGFIGGFYLLLAWVVESASLKERWDLWLDPPRLGLNGAVSFLERIWVQAPNLGDFVEVFRIFSTISLHSPSSFILLLVLIVGSIAYVEPNKNQPKWKQRLVRGAVGGFHGVAHVVALICVIWTVGYISHHFWEFEKVKDWYHAFWFIPGMTVLGGLVGGTIWGIYLLLSNLLLGCHTNAGSSAVKVKDYKNFLRLHLTADRLEVHAIGVEKVNRRWKLDRSAENGQPWLVPESGNVEDLAKVLEVVKIPPDDGATEDPPGKTEKEPE